MLVYEKKSSVWYLLQIVVAVGVHCIIVKGSYFVTSLSYPHFCVIFFFTYIMGAVNNYKTLS